MTSTPVEHGALVDWMGPWASMIPELTNPTLHLGTSLVLEEAARTDPRASHFYPNGLHTAPKKIIEVFDGTHTTMPFSSFFCTQPVSPIAECSNFSAGVSCEAGSPPARHLQGKSSAPRNQDHPHRSERPCLVEEMAIVLKWNCGTSLQGIHPGVRLCRKWWTRWSLKSRRADHVPSYKLTIISLRVYTMVYSSGYKR